MQSLLHGPRDIAPTNVGFDRIIQYAPQAREPPLVDRDRERERFGGVADDEHRILGFVFPFNDTVEIDERCAPPHRLSKADVVGVIGIGATIPIAEQTVLPDRVIVRARLAFLDCDRRDTERKAAHSWFEDALRCLQGHTFTVKDKPML